MSEATSSATDRAVRWRRATTRWAGAVGTATVCALPALGATAGGYIATQLSPYEAHIGDTTTEIMPTLDKTSSVTIETSIGDISSAPVTALPIGINIQPKLTQTPNQLAASAAEAVEDTSGYIEQVEAEARAAVWPALRHFVEMGLVGAVGGAFVGASVQTSLRRRNELDGAKHRGKPITAALIGVMAVPLVAAPIGAITYNEDWAKPHRLTGVFSFLESMPDQLEALHNLDTATAKKILAINHLFDVLDNPTEAKESPDTAVTILSISDVHLRNVYPYLQQYIDTNDVTFIINSGDETLFGTAQELTQGYIDSIAEITKHTPMIWVKGNHDSDETARIMGSIPGVIVLDKQWVQAYGLTIAGLGDPRDFTDGGDISTDTIVRLEQDYTESVAASIPPESTFDVFVTHVPAAATTFARQVGDDRIRLTVSGHTHQQSFEQEGTGHIAIVQGTTGMNGQLARGMPMAFGLLRVSDTCQITDVTMVQTGDPARPSADNQSPWGTNASMVTHFAQPQDTNPSRRCSPTLGIGAVSAWANRTEEQPEGTGADGDIEARVNPG